MTFFRSATFIFAWIWVFCACASFWSGFQQFILCDTVVNAMYVDIHISNDNSPIFSIFFSIFYFRFRITLKIDGSCFVKCAFSFCLLFDSETFMRPIQFNYMHNSGILHCLPYNSDFRHFCLLSRRIVHYIW